MMKRILLWAVVLALAASCGSKEPTVFDVIPGGETTRPEEEGTVLPEVVSVAGSARDNWQIYQVNLKLYGASGAFGKVQARLDEIQALGTEILYLMPVYPEGKLKAIGSPYCIRDFKGVNPAFGTLEDLRALVNAAHAKGMKVMFDWVANHTAWDNPWISEHPEWYEKDASGNITYPTRDGAWTDVAQLDYSNKQLWAAMEDALLYWVKELDIDGYRCDYAHGVRDDFWKEAIAALKAFKPGFIMLAESDFERMFNDGFDIIFDRAMKSHARTLFQNHKAADFFNWYRTDLGKTPEGKTKLFFITNHDDATEAAPADQFGSSEAGLAAYVLMSALNGSAMLYGSQEAGNRNKINFFQTQTFNFSANPALCASYKEALQALSGVDRSGQMKAYAEGNLLLVVYSTGSAVAVNIGSAEVTGTLPAPLTGTVTLPAYGFKVW